MPWGPTRSPTTVLVDGDFSLPDGAMSLPRLQAFWSQVCALAPAAGSAPLPLNFVYVGLLPGPTQEFGGYGGRNCIVLARLDGSGVHHILLTSQMLAHELGHALGLNHAGCGEHGEPTPCDPAPQVFPCVSGGICTYGFDTAAMSAIAPGNPPDGYHAHDFMSYGRGQLWVSPYTYRHLYDSLRKALAPAPPPAAALQPAPRRSTDRSAVTQPPAATHSPSSTSPLPLVSAVAALSVVVMTTSSVAIAVTTRRRTTGR